MKNIPSVDTVVLDVDGVIVDVSRSYRRAIVEAPRRVHDLDVDPEWIQLLKDAGGFNNDWDVTHALALYGLCRQRELAPSPRPFAEAIEARGGGLEAAREVLLEDLPEALRGELLNRWDPRELREVFQQLYLGRELYEQLEGRPATMDEPGYIYDEPVLLQEGTLRWLEEHVRIGILTGRPAAEADIALDRAGLDVPEEHRMTMDDEAPAKPNPEGLMELAARFSARRLVFVGDTLDDVRTARRAQDCSEDQIFQGIGVLTGGLTGQDGRRAYQQEGAVAVLESVNDLPEWIESETRSRHE